MLSLVNVNGVDVVGFFSGKHIIILSVSVFYRLIPVLFSNCVNMCVILEKMKFL